VKYLSFIKIMVTPV